MKSFDQRLGNGFMVVPVDEMASDAEITTVENKIKKIRTEMGVAIRQSKDNPLKPEWMSPQPGSDYVEHLTKYEEMFATGMGFPLRWLKGDPQGAQESGQSDLQQIKARLGDIFQDYVPLIKAVLMYHGLITSPEEIEIQPPDDIETSVLEQAQLDEVRTGVIAMKTWLTTNEKRLEDGYDEADEEQMAEIDAYNNPVTQAEAKGDQPAKAETKADSELYGPLAEAFRSLSLKQLAEVMGVSEGTVSKIRSKFDEENKPKLKTDAVKCDSVQLSGSLYEINDAKLVLPQRKFYEQYNRYCVRSPEAIKKAFNNPKTPRSFRIGVTPSNDHTSRVPLEVLSDSAVGTVELTRLDEEGAIRGNIKYDLAEVQKILGAGNWIESATKQQQSLHTSVALHTKDRIINNEGIEDDLDIRSFVFTTSPRNTNAGGS
jgi:transcriptional regulator with XRE-family HTH domain